MRQFLSNDAPPRRREANQIKDLLGLNERDVSVEEAAEAAVEKMLAAAKERRDLELKSTQNA